MKRIFKRTFAPLAAIGLAASVAACDMDIRMDGDGVPLAELDMSGEAPSEIALAGPDTVIVSEGDALTITVEGPDEIRDRMRFERSAGSLTVYREGDIRDDDGKATVSVTVPGLRALTVAGSGTIEAPSLDGNAEVTIAGSGTARVTAIDTDRLEVDSAGSGRFEGSGTTDSLELNIGGSGSAEMAGLKAGNAEVSIAGSGNASFASDGNVEANIFGSGTVQVSGSATCDINSFGSGRLVCSDAAATPDGEAAKPETESAE